MKSKKKQERKRLEKELKQLVKLQGALAIAKDINLMGSDKWKKAAAYCLQHAPEGLEMDKKTKEELRYFGLLPSGEVVQ